MLRPLWRLLRLALHVLQALAVVAIEWPRADAAARHRRIAWWSAGVLRCLGIGLDNRSAPAPGAKLLVANHVSWLDIVAIHAVCPQARFVAKADLRDWPLLDRLIAAGGTLYLRRESKRAALRIVHDMTEALRGGATVAVFPEGTTSDGDRLLPFHANLLQAAIVAKAPVQPMALRYADAQAPVSAAAAYTGETTLAQSVWRIARARDLRVQMQWLPPWPAATVDRRELAGALRQAIEAALHEPPTPGRR